MFLCAMEAFAPAGPFLGNLPAKFQTDNGKEFINSHFKTWCEENNIKFVHGLPYNPQAQGQVRMTSSSHPL